MSMSTEEQLAAVRENYDVLSVMVRVAQGRAQMQGVTPIAVTQPTNTGG